ncbi:MULTISPECIES: universal stress protein [Legionella]|uniref:Universal stress protein n=2 Tax=Legionella TaxID=445 RepID=A0A0W0TIU1_9GAMM|nr:MULTISPECIES: universal stress protein [Legionella]MCC5015967.1 universal stress protein [Legionella sp. 31fI33]KTC95435.1 universal stress protein A [Legionella feeleii]SPX60018.1 universal stress protein A [Legionella feeleii]STX38480.1 universal stress protein A [Legionella feeleii]STX42326.1 universal stress protein A [Legionella donaldsonii]
MYTSILHATDLSENHFDMCKQAVKIAHLFGATLHLLHVIEPPPSLQLAQGLGFAEFDSPVKDDAQAVMNVLGEALGIPPEQQHVEIGSIKMNVLDKVKALGCGLIIIGSHSPNALPAFLGSTAHAVVHHAPCDVLTIRNKI